VDVEHVDVATQSSPAGLRFADDGVVLRVAFPAEPAFVLRVDREALAYTGFT